MAKYEARIRTKFGEIVVSFDSTNELKSALQALDVEEVQKEVVERFKGLLSREPRPSKPGFERIYRFTPEGKVELLRTPPSAPMTIGMLLHASAPEPMSSDEIFSSTGIKVGNYVSQTAYKNYFDRTPDGRLVLTHLGRLWVETEVVGKLAPKVRNRKQRSRHNEA
jgi:hypothetical protein